MPDSAEKTTHRSPAMIAVIAAGAALAFLAVFIGLATTGEMTPGELIDEGALVRWGLPALGVARAVFAAGTIGAFALAAWVIPPANSGWALAVKIGRWCALIWPLAALGHILFTFSSISVMGFSDPSFGASFWQFVTELALGQSLGWSVVFAAVVAIFAWATAGLTMANWTVCLSLVALVPVALTGHAAGAADHRAAVSSAYMHLGGITVWVGGLVVLCLVAWRAGSDLAPIARRYSALALWAFIFTVVSGIIASWIRLETPLDLLTTPYGRLLAIKIIATVALGFAGWDHRRRRVAALSDEAARGRPGAVVPKLEGTARAAFLRLCAGEVILMGLAMGLAVALANSAPPVPQEPQLDASPVFILSGYSLPPLPDALHYMTEWRLEPLLATLTVIAAVQYVRWVRRLRRRGDAWPVNRTVSWLIGLALFGWATNGGPAVYGSVLFSAHMLMHMLLAMFIPVFLTLAAPMTLLMRAVPPRRDGSRGPREWLLGIVHSRYGRIWEHPVVAGLNFAGSLIIFYFSPLFEQALITHVGHILMVVHFTLAGYMFANALVGIDPGPSRPAYPMRLVLLLATMGFHAFFGIAVINSTDVLANEYFGWLGVDWGINALADQEAGGVITWAIGEIPTLALAIGVVWAWARADDSEAKRYDRRAERDHDAELRAYNEMLARRAERSTK